ncbi:MAG: cysteine hydrolase [Phycisphaerales bacterium]
MNSTLTATMLLLSTAGIAVASLGLGANIESNAKIQSVETSIVEDKVVDLGTTALLITDPQNDFLRQDGVAYGFVKEDLERNNTIENIETLLRSAKIEGMPVFISPHMYHEHDGEWNHRGAIQQVLEDGEMYKVTDAYYRTDLRNGGADFFEPYKKYILDGKTVITSPHKVFGPETNDLVLQLRKRGITKVLVGGLAGNLCTEGHLRELIEQGFEVVMISDAVASPGAEAHEAAITNYSMIANQVITTQEAVNMMLN